MADPTKEQLDAKAKSDAEAKAKHDAEVKAKADGEAKPAHSDPNTAAIAEVMKGMLQRVSPTAPAATVGLDETQPGGVYIVKGKKVNAHGRELNDDGTIKHPEQLRVNEFGQMV